MARCCVREADGAGGGPRVVGDSWPCVHEFLAIVTHPRIYSPPAPIAAAIDQVEALLESPSLVLLAESEAHWRALREALISGSAAEP